jgi:hypothetical protein
MPEPTYIACPHCGEPFPMSAMQKQLFIGRTLSCQQCAKPFAITEQTPDPIPAPKRQTFAVPQNATAAAAAAPAPAPTPVPAPAAAAPKPRRHGEGLTAGKMAGIIALVACVVGYLMCLALAPSIHRSREAGRRMTCASNLTQIAVALQYYATSNGGKFPVSLTSLVQDGSIPVELLVCPSATGDTVAPGKTPQEQAGNLPKGSHMSFVYVGKGLSFASTKQVLAYEPLNHHDGEGVNVLYSDGTVQFLPRAKAIVTIPALAPGNAATQPVVPATQSAD